MSAGTPGPPEEEDIGGVVGPVVVTDAELAVLQAAHCRLVGEGRPLEPGRDARTEDPAEHEAMRSLVARGLLDPGGELTEEGDVGLVLSTVLDVRLAASSVLVVERIVSAGPDLGADAGGADSPGGAAGHVRRHGVRHGRARHGGRLVHLVDSGACVEDLLPDGSHHLYLALDPDSVVRAVTDVTVPHDAVPGWGRPRTVAADRPEDLPCALGYPSVIAALSVLSDPLPDQDAGLRAVLEAVATTEHLVGLGPTGCWVSDVGTAANRPALGTGPPAPPVPGALVFTPAHPCWVEQWVRSAQQGRQVPAARPMVVPGQGTMSG